MAKSVVRYRLYRVARYYHVEIWDTLSDQWESKHMLPSGELLLVLEDTEIDSMKRYRKRALRQHNVSERGFTTWDCTPLHISKVLNEK